MFPSPKSLTPGAPTSPKSERGTDVHKNILRSMKYIFILGFTYVFFIIINGLMGICKALRFYCTSYASF